jgi:hypothetical protein
MTSGTRISTGGILAFLLLTSGVSQGAPFAYQFTGVIERVRDPSTVLDSSVQPGTTFSGEFKFDSDAEDLDPRPDFGDYRGPQFSLALSMGSYYGSSENGRGAAYVSNNSFAGDVLTVAADGPFSIGGNLIVTGLGGNLIDDTGTVFSSDVLPTGPILFSSFQSSPVFVKGTDGDGLGSFELLGTLTSFAVIPEPSTLSLILLAVAGTPLWSSTTALKKLKKP